MDNASSDDSPDTVARKFPQVKLIKNEENLGFARANNIGIKQSIGRYVCLINSDVIVLENCIQNLIEFMDTHLNVGIAGPRILNPDHTLQICCRNFPTIWNNLCQAFGLNYIFPKSAFFSGPFMKYWDHDEVRKVDVITGCFWIVRREAVDNVGLLDEDFFIYGEDVDWCRRFNQSGWDIAFNPDAEAVHFGGASSSNAPIKFYLEMQKADIKYWEKHHGKIGKVCYTMIVLIHNILRVIAGALRYPLWPSRRENIRLKLKRSIACIRWILHI